MSTSKYLNELRKLSNCVFVTYTFHGDVKCNKGPIVSGGFKESSIGCTCVGMLSPSGFAALAHIGPYEDEEMYVREMINLFVKNNESLDKASVIVSGTYHVAVRQIAAFFLKKGMRTKEVSLPPCDHGASTMGIDTQNKTFRIYRESNDKNTSIPF